MKIPRYTQYGNVEILADRKAWLTNDNADYETMAVVKMITHVSMFNYGLLLTIQDVFSVC